MTDCDWEVTVFILLMLFVDILFIYLFICLLTEAVNFSDYINLNGMKNE
jgi:hypothetical protein